MGQEPGDHGREARIAGYLRLLAPAAGLAIGAGPGAAMNGIGAGMGTGMAAGVVGLVLCQRFEAIRAAASILTGRAGGSLGQWGDVLGR